MIESVFDICNQFMKNPQYVSINKLRVKEVADDIKPTKEPVANQDELQKTVEYQLTASAVNYCYWYGRHDVRSCGVGATRMYQHLDEAWQQYPGLHESDKRLEVFKALMVTGRYPLLEQRLAHIDQVKAAIDFVPFVTQNIRGIFDVNECLTELILRMPGFGADLFLKRAFLFFMMVHRATGILPTEELRKLPIPADYQVPKMLQWLGVLEYRGELVDDIVLHRVIPSGSLKECEIRAASILACKALSEECGQSMCDVDDYLWSRRKSCDRPFHLTVTTDY